jgi:hypothetical protein
MPLLEIPQPYDFEISTERFRAFGPDYANLWHEGGLLRVVGGRGVRIEAAPGGVRVEPLDAEIEAEVGSLLGLPFDLDAFYRWARRADPVARRVASEPGLARSPRLFEGLVTSISAQQVSLFAAFAIRNRLIERFGERGEHAFSFPTRERLADADENELALGFSTARPSMQSPCRLDLDLDALAAPGRRGQGADHELRGLGRTADWPSPATSPGPRLGPGDLGVQGGGRVLW